MTKEMLKGLIELVSEEDIETLYNVVVKFIPENVPLPDEIEAIERADKSIKMEQFPMMPLTGIK